MNFKKRVNGSWTDIPHYIHNTSTDTITTLPADVYANAATATVGVKGQMEQSSQPSPQTPIQPSECGNLTGNLLDRDTETKGVYVGTDGEEHSSSGWSASDYIPLDASTAYYISISTTAGNSPKHCFYDANKEFISYIASGSRGFTTPNNAAYGRFSYTVGSSQVMLNTGSTALPYEPFGVKIPILSANTTTPVYLGEVETTRQIRKLVFDGTENFSNQYGTNLFSVVIQPLGKINFFNSYCTHYKYNPVQSGLNANTQNGEYALQVQSTQTLFAVKDVTYASPEDFKAYLAQQYAAGTPVTVWYVLATPTTGIVNEPLRKIGTYADEVSGITIPTIAGANTLSVDTTLQPSEVTVNYKGWHPVQSVHEYDSNYTIATMQALTIAQLQTHTISELEGGWI